MFAIYRIIFFFTEDDFCKNSARILSLNLGDFLRQLFLLKKSDNPFLFQDSVLPITTQHLCGVKVLRKSMGIVKFKALYSLRINFINLCQGETRLFMLIQLKVKYSSHSFLYLQYDLIFI